MIRIQCFLISALMVQHLISAFAPHVSHIQKSMEETELRYQAVDQELDAMLVMTKSRECANSDSCSIEEGESLLNEMLHLQSYCAIGTIRNHDVCEDITIPNEIIAGLRRRIETSRRTPANAVAITSMMSPVFLSMFTIYLVCSIVEINHHTIVDALLSQ